MSRIITNPEVLVSKVTGRLHEVAMRLESRGITYEDWQDIITESDFADAIADVWRRKGTLLSIDDAIARYIMGPCGVFGPQEWERFYGIKLSARALDRFRKINIPREILEMKKETHFLCLLLSDLDGSFLTIDYARNHTNPFGMGPIALSHSMGNTRGHPFITGVTSRPGWHLMRRGSYKSGIPLDTHALVPESCGKPWDEQKALLPPDEEVPLAVEEFYKNIHFMRLARVFVNSGMKVRTRASLDDDFAIPEYGKHIPVVEGPSSFFSQNVDTEDKDSTSDNIGVTSALRLIG